MSHINLRELEKLLIPSIDSCVVSCENWLKILYIHYTCVNSWVTSEDTQLLTSYFHVQYNSIVSVLHEFYHYSEGADT